MTVIEFWVAGIPKPQGSKRAFVVKGRPVLTESAGGALKDWRAVVAHEAALAVSVPIDGPVSVVVTFHMPRPKSLPKSRPSWPAKRPDIDKLVRAVLDSMSSIVYGDDAQIVTLTARKVYVLPNGIPGVRVRVEPGAL